jgi:hypothetical protein
MSLLTNNLGHEMTLGRGGNGVQGRLDGGRRIEPLRNVTGP